MPIFLTEVSSLATDMNNLVLLKDELAQHDFELLEDGRKHLPGRTSLHFKQYAGSIYEVTTVVLKAVKKTGKDFSFTVIKSK